MSDCLSGVTGSSPVSGAFFLLEPTNRQNTQKYTANNEFANKQYWLGLKCSFSQKSAISKNKWHIAGIEHASPGWEPGILTIGLNGLACKQLLASDSWLQIGVHS